MASNKPEKKSARGGLVYSTETGDMRKSGLSGLEKIQLPGQTQKVSKEPSSKIVVKLDSKKHRGKTVTMVEGIASAKLEPLLKLLKVACGVGGHTDEGVLFLQGDQRQRIAQVLANNDQKIVVR